MIRMVRLVRRSLSQPEMAAGGMLVCFLLAILVPGARTYLLAFATLAATAWIGWDALVEDRGGPRARLVMTFALLMLAAVPAMLLAFDPELWVAPPRLRSLDPGLLLWSLGVAAIATGSRLGRIGSAGGRGPQPSSRDSWVPRRKAAGSVLVAIVAVSLIAFVHKVGGPVKYLTSLNKTATIDASLTYLMWGISFGKYGTYVCLAERWRAGRRPGWRLVALSVCALTLVLFLGSRLLFLASLIQLLLLYAAIRPAGRRFLRGLIAAVVVGAIVFIGLGEYRRWENLPAPRPSFSHYFVRTSLPNLPRTYVNNYADTVRSSVIVRQVVPARAGYEYGKEFLRLLLQPIPGSLRPKVSEAPALHAAFTAGRGNANALPLPVEGYIEFGLAGDIALCLILGAIVGLLDAFAPAAVRDVGLTATAIALGTGAVIVFRGSLHNAFAIAAIDVIGFFVAHRVLFRRPVASSSAPPVTEPSVSLVAEPPPSTVSGPPRSSP
jgi:hypothetical protein